MDEPTNFGNSGNSGNSQPGQDPIEELLRRSLQARAQDVSPNPATWQVVEAGVRRGRIVRWTTIGAGLTAAAVMAAVVLPGLFNGASVDLDRADGTGGDGAPTTADFNPCGGPDHVSAVFARNGDDDVQESTIWALCDDASQSLLDYERPAGAHDTAPVLAWDGSAVAFERRLANGTWKVMVLDMRSGTIEAVADGRLPAFAPDGRLAWVKEIGQGQDRILIGRPGSEPELEFPVVEGEDGEWFNARRLAWDASAETLYAEIGYEASIVISYDVASLYRSSANEPFAQAQLTTEADVRYAGPATGPDPDSVALIARCCSEWDGEPFTAAYLRLLPGAPNGSGGDAGATKDVRLPEEFDVNGTPWAAWAPIGELRQVAEGPYTWTGGRRHAYLVGDGDGAWMVQPDGTITLIAWRVSSMSANPSLSPDGPGEAPNGVAQEQAGLAPAVATTRQRIWPAISAG